MRQRDCHGRDEHSTAVQRKAARFITNLLLGLRLAFHFALKVLPGDITEHRVISAARIGSPDWQPPDWPVLVTARAKFRAPT